MKPFERRAGLRPGLCSLSALVFAAIFLPAAARAQLPLLDATVTRISLSGQFVVIGVNPVLSSNRVPFAATNDDLVRLDPALLAVAAERVKKAVWQQLGVDALAQWRGRIFLALHPAASPDENVAIVSARLGGTWNYRVELPDALSRARLTRALTGVVLLELANRDNPDNHAPEVPPWLTEGLAEQLLANGGREMILSKPDTLVPVFVPSAPDPLANGVPQDRITVVQRGVDPLATARSVLRGRPTLTFEQLSWPDDAQLRGQDGGVYRASAQLFVNDLLALNDGAAKLSAMLQMLPRCYNWQLAFRAAFLADFPQPIDAEKWWALQTASFDSRDAGPLWTAAASRDKLAELLSVPVEMRSAPTNLPAYAAISLQTAIRSLPFDRQASMLQTKVRDLDLAHWRMAPQFVVLTDAYRRTLADYLALRGAVASASNPGLKRMLAASPKQVVGDAVKKLDALDAQRRAIETALRTHAPAGTPL